MKTPISADDLREMFATAEQKLASA